VVAVEESRWLLLRHGLFQATALANVCFTRTRDAGKVIHGAHTEQLHKKAALLTRRFGGSATCDVVLAEAGGNRTHRSERQPGAKRL
jgi:hypothetical protein